MSLLSLNRLREVLSYNPETGALTWIDNKRFTGLEAGHIKRDGYRQIKVDGKTYLAHRLAWLHAHGSWPAACLDHVNGIPSDNRLANLRQASFAQNQQNRRVQRGASSGHTGVTWHKNRQAWQARIYLNRIEHYLGLFDTKDAALAAYAEKKSQLHTFHPDVVAR